MNCSLSLSMKCLHFSLSLLLTHLLTYCMCVCVWSFYYYYFNSWLLHFFYAYFVLHSYDCWLLLLLLWTYSSSSFYFHIKFFAFSFIGCNLKGILNEFQTSRIYRENKQKKLHNMTRKKNKNKRQRNARVRALIYFWWQCNRWHYVYTRFIVVSSWHGYGLSVYHRRRKYCQEHRVQSSHRERSHTQDTTKTKDGDEC